VIFGTPGAYGLPAIRADGGVSVAVGELAVVADPDAVFTEVPLVTVLVVTHKDGVAPVAEPINGAVVLFVHPARLDALEAERIATGTALVGALQAHFPPTLDAANVVLMTHLRGTQCTIDGPLRAQGSLVLGTHQAVASEAEVAIIGRVANVL
jgi:hypothetical protein